MASWILAVLFGFSGATWAASEKTFVYCSEASPSTFNPQLADDGPTFNASSQMLFNRLLEFKDGGTELVPGLATKWDVSKDGKVYTFHLRPDVRFHTTESFKPSRAMNADDVIFSFERVLNPKHSYHKVSGGKYLFAVGMELDQLITKIEKVNDSTVRFTLKRPEAPFLANLAMSWAVIHSKEYAEAMEKAGSKEKVDTDPVGTGPFVLKRYVKDNSIRYDAHPDYWEGRAKLDKVVFAITPEPSVRYQKLKAGECHLIAEPSPQDLASMAVHPKLKLVSQPGANIGYLAFNVEKPPFNNVKVRQAVQLALNRPQYIKIVYQDTAIVANAPLPPTVWGAHPSLTPPQQDLERAKMLLKEAGFAGGFNTELWTLPVSRPYNPNGKKMGELMQADLAKIGIQVKLVTYDWPTYLAKARNGEHALIQLGWTTDNGDPDNFLNTLLSCAAIKGGGNMSRWCDKEYDKITLKAKSTTDLKARTQAYLKAQELFGQQVPWVTLAHAKVFRGLTSNVEGYKISPMGVENFYPIELK